MPAPKKNKFAIGNSGKPKMFGSVNELQQEIDKYFERCDGIVTDEMSLKDILRDQVPYTIEGLSNAIGCDRDTLNNYEKKEGYEEYFGTIKKAKSKIQQNKIERGLLGMSHATVSIFDLKNNHGYVDKTEVKSEGSNVLEIITYDKPLNEN